MIKQEIDKNRINYLVKELGKDSEKAGTELYLEINDYLFHFAFSICHDVHIAQDAVSETFRRILIEARNKMFYTNCFGWITKILLNVLSNERRKHKPIYSSEFVEMVCGEDEEIKDLYIKLEIDKLDYRSQLVVHYIYIEGFKIYETAKIMKTPLATFKRRHAKLLKKLEVMLNDK